LVQADLSDADLRNADMSNAILFRAPGGLPMDPVPWARISPAQT